MSVTIKDIAKVANVSYATVSRALNNSHEISEKTKKKIKEIADEMGYMPNEIAKGLVTKSSSTIGLIVPDITNPFFSELAQGFEECANKSGFQVFLCNSNWDMEREMRYLTTLYGKRVDGIVITPATNEVDHLSEGFKNMPMVIAAYRPSSDECNYVVIDDYKSAVIATEYMVKLGHRKIAFIGGREESNTNIDRICGYADTLKKYNIEYKDSYIKNGKYKQDSGYELTKELLLKNETPTAVLAGNDMIALGVIQAIEEFGLKVPENISVVGFDDISYASLDKIQLTTVRQPKYKIGEMCFEILYQMIQNPKDKTHISKVLEPELIIRKTCKGI